ncbi:unnamed protein product [Owenia fusiformis]|uniref:Uncharacterized protein n=1 Tax=Owenia fusiformis TaxID=6347 RepID=A0A8J1UMB7_OWEFU|nr:unnamed protein product [Owenia fusiformis]
MAMARATFDTSGKYKPIHPGYARLTEFVNVTAAKVDIFSKYTDVELEHHTKYIMDFVRLICSGFGEYNKLFKTKEPIPRGSYFDKTKIISPTEYDFLNPLSLSDDASVQVCDVSDDCGLAGHGYGVVNIHPGQLQQQLLDLYSTEDYDEYDCDSDDDYVLIKHPPYEVILHSSHDSLGAPGDVYWLTTNISESLHTEMHTYLENTHGSHYIGERYHKYEQHPSYTLGEFSMHEDLHGPSVWLRVGGPLGTTDIDLCFCIRGTQGSVLVPIDLYCDKCPSYIHWTESIVEPQHPGAPDHQLHNPTGHHKQLFLVLKYISHLYSKIYWHIYNARSHLISSYSYKLLIMHHQKHCTGSDFYIGRCFEDVVEYIFNQFRGDDDDSDLYRLYREDIYLPDTYYPDREVRVVNGYSNRMELTVLLFMLKHVKHSNDTQWWQKLLDDEFPNNVSSGDVLFQSLLDLVKHVWDALLQGELTEHIDWQHEDGTRTHLTITRY